MPWAWRPRRWTDGRSCRARTLSQPPPGPFLFLTPDRLTVLDLVQLGAPSAGEARVGGAHGPQVLRSIWPIFAAETREQIQAIGTKVLGLEQGPAERDPDLLPSLKRWCTASRAPRRAWG